MRIVTGTVMLPYAELNIVGEEEDNCWKTIFEQSAKRAADKRQDQKEKHKPSNKGDGNPHPTKRARFDKNAKEKGRIAPKISEIKPQKHIFFAEDEEKTEQ